MGSAVWIFLIFLGLIVPSTIQYSLSIRQFDSLIKPRCFNRSKLTGEELILGQNEPIGMSMENLISAIEKLETLNPTFPPATIIQIILERFHLDGVQFDGIENFPSSIGFHHSTITEAIVGLKQSAIPSIPFPEHQFTEDEKCNLFFTISHFVNETASVRDDEMDTFSSEPIFARTSGQNTFVMPPNSRNIGDEVVIHTTTEKPLKEIPMDSFKDDTALKKHTRRDTKYRKTKHPREYGVASFLWAKNNPINVARVLLGMLVGFSRPTPKLMSQIIKQLNKKLPKEMKDQPLDPLLSVTLADIYGIDVLRMSPINEMEIFGADGNWNDTVCHTEFILKNNEGLWGTLAEFRGGLDGYSIGSIMSSDSFFKVYPNITASQVLRLYYSRQGLFPNTGVCNRQQHVDSQFVTDLKEEALKYLIIWNSHFYDALYTIEKLAGYINSLEKHVAEVLTRSSAKNAEETRFCTEPIATNIKDKPCEADTNAFFLLDMNQACQRNRHDSRCKQAIFVSEMVKRMNLKRNLGSVSVFYNAEGAENPDIIDDQFRPVKTPLYPLAYNSTSGECAACKALYGDTTGKRSIQDRTEMLKLIKELIEQHDQKYENLTGVPGKAFFWIDFGSVQPIPNDKLQYARYQNNLRKLLYQERDTVFFAAATNTTSLADVILDKNNIIQIIPNNNIIENDAFNRMGDKLCQVPSVLQYADCQRQPSKNVVYSGLITPNYKQYWVINPKHFLKSFRIEMKFAADNEELEVCHSRTPFPENDAKNCRYQNGTVIISNPCHGRTTENCQPLFFTISLKNPSKTNPFCTDINCKNSKQVRWSVTHTGISCNKSATIQISAILMLITILMTSLSTKFFNFFN